MSHLKNTLKYYYSQNDVRFLKGVGFNEFVLFVILLAVVLVFAIVDISTDILDNETFAHIFLDLVLSVFALSMIGYLTHKFGQVRVALSKQLMQTSIEKDEAAKQALVWQAKAQQLKQGLSDEIETKMQDWSLSQAEREVGLLLLKGLSLKEIADIRQTSERTVRHQSLSVYAKANVAGRAELSAYFLEDFLDRSSVASKTKA